MMKHRTKPMVALIRGATFMGVAAVCLPTQAIEFEAGDWFLTADTTLAYAAQWRTEPSADALTAKGNDNDGNNNFDPGLVSNRVSALFELAAERDNLSFFIRADYAYDDVYENQKTDLSVANFATYNSGTQSFNAAFVGGPVGDTARGDFPDETLDEHGTRFRLLDAFVSYTFDVGDQSGSVRLGRQVISWGESTFFQGANAIVNPTDGAAALSPGTEAKEVFLPTNAIDLKWDFSPNFSAEIYAKLEWDKTTQPGVGSFMSKSDATGPGAQIVNFFGPFNGVAIQEDKPDGDGQWGAAIRFVTDAGTNFGLNFIKAHANVPGALTMMNGAPLATALGFDPASAPLVPFVDMTATSFLQEVYTEDIEVWSFVTSGNLGEAQVYADFAYSDNMPFVDTTFSPIINGFFPGGVPGAVVANVVRGHYYQVSVGMTDIYSALPWLAPRIILLAEALYQGNNLGRSDYVAGDLGIDASDYAWGYQGRVILNYYKVIPGMDMDVALFFKHDVEGYGNAIAMNNDMVEGLKTGGVSFDAFYLSNWKMSLKYSFFAGEHDARNKLRDRDNVSIGVKYSF